MGMSSLDINQQDAGDGYYDGFSRPNIDLGAKLGLTELDDPGRQSPAPSFEDGSHDQDDFPLHTEDPVESYGLRKNINRVGAASTHLDHDQSGNYDPAEEAARQKSTKMTLMKRMKQAQQAKKEKAGSKKRKGKGKAVPKSLGEIKEKRIARLKIRAMGSVLNITDGKDNWPEHHSVIDSEDEADRRELLSYYRERSPGTPPPPQIPVLDPKGEEENLINHPVARGCKECRVKEVICSMRVNGEYPCAGCDDTHIECNPIMEPALTRPCERCEGLGKPCSFAKTGANPCVHLPLGPSRIFPANCEKHTRRHMRRVPRSEQSSLQTATAATVQEQPRRSRPRALWRKQKACCMYSLS